MFEFQLSGIEPEEFLPRREKFLAQLPTRYESGVEVRTPFLGPRYHDTLKAYGVAHVYNHLYGMRSLEEQHRARGTSLNRGSLLANHDLYGDRESGETGDVTQVVEYMVRPAGV